MIKVISQALFSWMPPCLILPEWFVAPHLPFPSLLGNLGFMLGLAQEGTGKTIPVYGVMRTEASKLVHCCPLKVLVSKLWRCP